ncbi:lysine histidine transporter 1-like [Camellia sinensis]|uniref:lysine histidine transporter 1-like n=1 Tax=Camellia sinensis TaxID=4442 RepID=UPI0010366290|nr:lysine histidine transporter 1-like [Camellia sinensis]
MDVLLVIERISRQRNAAIQEENPSSHSSMFKLNVTLPCLGCFSDKGVQPHAEYGYKAKTTVGTVFNFFSALGEVAFAYARYNVVLEISSDNPSTPEKLSRALVEGVIVATSCGFDFPVSLIGVFGIGTNQTLFELVVSKRFIILISSDPHELRFITRLLLAFDMFVAITFPFFSGLLGFFGGFAFAPTTYFPPCVMWLASKKPEKFSLSWLINWICIILGVLLMIVSPIGGLRQIIIQAKGYQFYS